MIERKGEINRARTDLLPRLVNDRSPPDDRFAALLVGGGDGGGASTGLAVGDAAQMRGSSP
jgi:hypothetical protein